MCSGQMPVVIVDRLSTLLVVLQQLPYLRGISLHDWKRGQPSVGGQQRKGSMRAHTRSMIPWRIAATSSSMEWMAGCGAPTSILNRRHAAPTSGYQPHS